MEKSAKVWLDAGGKEPAKVQELPKPSDFIELISSYSDWIVEARNYIFSAEFCNKKSSNSNVSVNCRWTWVTAASSAVNG